ncbi:MAG: hypothetical protein HQ511_02455, partial [Rhodospirillales bacterium]|nr:hypothetical protein [Rhodospirillales bacterium]
GFHGDVTKDTYAIDSYFPEMATYRATFEYGWDDGEGWWMLHGRLYVNDDLIPVIDQYAAANGPYDAADLMGF